LPHVHAPATHVRLAPHVWPEQHASLSAPHSQAPPSHDRPPLHIEPLQHGWPCAPHWQVPALQVRLLPQAPAPSQQSWSCAPHGKQPPGVQINAGAHMPPTATHIPELEQQAPLHGCSWLHAVKHVWLVRSHAVPARQSTPDAQPQAAPPAPMRQAEPMLFPLQSRQVPPATPQVVAPSVAQVPPAQQPPLQALSVSPPPALPQDIVHA
jgi:hypothetical protein